jgi:hypothetical protein
MRRFFNISGYWKDDKCEFGDYLVTDFDDHPEHIDDDLIFFYGLSEEEIKDAIEKGEDTVHEFVITDYEDVTEDYQE